jgi:hypothetical protein
LQFFTSKPLLLGTEVVTSKSVFPESYPKKRGRESSDELDEDFPIQPGGDQMSLWTRGQFLTTLVGLQG